MKTIIFDGEAFALKKEAEVKEKVAGLGFKPRLVSLFFREDGSSLIYTRLKQEAALRVGIAFHPEELSFAMPMESVRKVISDYSGQSKVAGLLIQKPRAEATAGLAEVGRLGYKEWWKELTAEISPDKDVDCLTEENLERVYRGNYEVVPATVRAVLSILKEAIPDIGGKKAAVIGRSELVGKPLAHVLAQQGAEVFLCGSEGLAGKSLAGQITENIKPEALSAIVPECDLVVSVTGKARLIRGEMVKEGAIVVDVGEPIGDVKFEEVAAKAAFITPVPGGVGPVTVVSLLENLVEMVSISKL